ncbi:transcriptional regulator family: Fungal Specific TF [Paecilomyces variotii]|nr:transcriptional regulator family: Fungal Specific TF [Paecilomyces variotii]KAJ9351782.1 transcriptional regulator family: Fungal Specific TF [Paecilomyces variotii]
MVAIGSQYDNRHNAKEYSLALLEACLKLLSKRTPITSRSRITDIQTVFLLEYLSKFRSRRADVQLSHRFRSLCGSYMHDRHWISQNPLAVLNTLPENPSQEALTKAYKFWVEHEARRRVLQAAFIFDAQQSALFGQPRVLVQQAAVSSRLRKSSVGTTDLPFPCDSNLWETWHLEDWFRTASSHRSLSLPSVAMASGLHGQPSSRHLDTFQCTLLLVHNLTSQRSEDSEAWLAPSEGYDQYATSSVPSQPCSLFTYHALSAARHTPLHALLTVSGESWLFNRKVPHEEDFRKAKDTLRRWASDTEDIRKAVWHAVRVLECAMYHAYPNALLRDNARATASQGHRATGSRIPRSSPALSAPPMPLLAGEEAGISSAAQSGPLAMLHANWALYISALICWAYGFDPSTSTISASYPSNMLSRSQTAIAASARSYISTMISLAPTWQQLSHNRIPVTVRCNTLSLLGFIRTTRLQEGRMGGLLNEGERVLARLTETRATVNAEGRSMWEYQPVSF